MGSGSWKSASGPWSSQLASRLSPFVPIPPVSVKYRSSSLNWAQPVCWQSCSILGSERSFMAATTWSLKRLPTVICALAPHEVGSQSKRSNSDAGTSMVGIASPVSSLPDTLKWRDVVRPSFLTTSRSISAVKLHSRIGLASPFLSNFNR